MKVSISIPETKNPLFTLVSLQPIIIIEATINLGFHFKGII